MFFQNMQDQIEEYQQKLTVWKQNFSQQKIDIELLNNYQEKLTKLQNYVKNIKVYIIFQGTLSAGKSTFINSLLGLELLPSRTQECTKQLIFVTHEDNLQINNQGYDSLQEAEQSLLKMQNDQNLKEIYVKAPSLFHSEIEGDLASKICFVDTYIFLLMRPGIKIGDQQAENQLQQLKEKIRNDHDIIINVQVSDYSQFHNDKERIFQVLDQFQAEFKRPDNQQIDDNFQNQQQQNLDNNYMGELLFVLNKMDSRSKQKDVDINGIIQEIQRRIEGDNFIYQISSQRALQYRIMNQGVIMAKEKLIQSIFYDKQDDEGFQNIQECEDYCNQKIKNNKNLIKNQDYSVFLDSIIQKIKAKIKGNTYNQVVAYDVYLNLLLNTGNNLRIQYTSQQTKKQLTLIIQIISQFVIQFEKKIQKIEKEGLESLEKIIKEQQRFLDTKEHIVSILLEVCHGVFRLQIQLGKKISRFQEESKSEIQTQINKLEGLHELLNGCNHNILNEFANKQANNIENEFEKYLSNVFLEVLGIQVIEYLQKSMIAFKFKQLGEFYVKKPSPIECVQPAEQILHLTVLQKCNFLAIPALASLIGSEICIFQNQRKMQQEFSSIDLIQEKLNQIHEVMKKQIKQFCAEQQLIFFKWLGPNIQQAQ